MGNNLISNKRLEPEIESLDTDLESLNLEIEPLEPVELCQKQPKKTTLNLKKFVKKGSEFRVDEHGVGWRRYHKGEWMCLGNLMGDKKVDAASEKKKKLELKRLKMLTY